VGGEDSPKELTDSLSGIEDNVLIIIGHEYALIQSRDEADEGGGAFFDIGDLHQFIWGGSEHGLQVTEFMDQLMSDRVCISLRDGIEEEEFEEFMVSEGIGAAAQELVTFSISMALMDIHIRFSFPYWSTFLLL